MATPEEDFEAALDGDLVWRRVELQALAGQLRSAAATHNDSPLTRALARSMTTMLYAHWEGYCKHLFEGYERLIVKRKPVLSELNDALALRHLTHALKRASSGDEAGVETLLLTIRGEANERLRLPRGSLSNTRANLRFDTLCDLLDGFGLTRADFELKEKLIDTLLCDRRNVIAHGRASFPEPQSVLDLRTSVDDMMSLLRDLVVGEMRRQGYRR